MKKPQVFRQQLQIGEAKSPLVLDLSQHRTIRNSSVERAASLQKSSENVEQLVDMWQKHKSLFQNISPNINSGSKRSESFIIQEIAETRECSPPSMYNTITEQQSMNSTRKHIFHKKTQSICVSNLIKNDTQKIVNKRSSQKENVSVQPKKPLIPKKPSKELQQVLIQLQNVKRSVQGLYKNVDKQTKTTIENKIQDIINQVRLDIQ